MTDGDQVNRSPGIKGRVLLVSAPWPLFNRPSLPLGALKAYLSETLPRLNVQASHLFLKVANELGYEQYQGVSRRVWRAEAVFAALMYPSRADQAELLYARTLKRGHRAPDDFQQMVRQVKMIIDEWIQQVEWPTLDLVGFSISFCQVTASLYLISRIKEICPSLPVVVGGSSFSGERSANLMKVFPTIDFLVVGEGERPLAGLLRHLLDPCRKSVESLPEGVFSPNLADGLGARYSQFSRMDQLPVPDYDDYFSLLDGFDARHRFFPTLPVEASRGCWWHRQDARGHFKGCAFCNLNLQWRGYRTKRPDQVIRDVDDLVRRYQVLSLAFADNAFPINHAAAIFDGIRALGRDLSIFTELRANTSPALLRKMQQAGVDTVQVGIEALSTSLLAKMNKGARTIDNLCLMKQCETLGIINASNLMLHFPGSDDTDVNDTLYALEFARWYRPLKPVGFWLGLDSPVFRFARLFHIRSVFNHPHLKKLFPESVAAEIRFMIQGYRGDRKRQQVRWRSVKKKIRQWQDDYATMQRQTRGEPAMSLRDGGRFLVVDQHFPDQPTVRHRLTGISAELYRYCHIPRSLTQVVEAYTTHRPAQIRQFFETMVEKRLMFAEKDYYLSLAAPASIRR